MLIPSAFPIDASLLTVPSLKRLDICQGDLEDAVYRAIGVPAQVRSHHYIQVPKSWYVHAHPQGRPAPLRSDCLNGGQQ